MAEVMEESPAVSPDPASDDAPNIWLVRLAAFFRYAFGVICWVVVLDVLAVFGGFNVWSAVDGLWMHKLHDGLVRNAIGDIAFRAENGYGEHGAGARYIYSVSYQPHGKKARREVRSLTSLVDVKSWHFASASGVTTSASGVSATYLDEKHRYTVLTNSDGADITAGDR